MNISNEEKDKRIEEIAALIDKSILLTLDLIKESYFPAEKCQRISALGALNSLSEARDAYMSGLI